MFCRRSLVPLAVLVVAACDSRPPTAPDVSDPSFVLIDGTTSGNSEFFVLPPAVMGQPSITSTFDPTLRPRVVICEWSVPGNACVAGGATFLYTTTSGPGGAVVRVEDDHYMVNWDLRLDGIEPGKVFRATVFLVNRGLGSVDFEIGATGQDVKNIRTGDNVGVVDEQTLPFKFFVGLGAVEEEEERAEADCANGDVIDCDVEIIDSSEGGSATVVAMPGQAGETPAAIVTINPDDVVDGDGNPVSDFVLTAQHVETEPAPPTAIPLGQQIPFFVQVTAVDDQGDPVFFNVGATLVLCQPPDLGDSEAPLFIPDELHQFLKIFQVSDGVTEILPTTLDNQENCPGGLHGGLNTVGIKKFSGFGATLPTSPSASTAVVGNGTVGTPTVIDIQAMLDATSNQIFGGDEVVVTVSGANSASPAITDNGDGTYTTQYTPSVAGTDMIDIRIRNLVTGVLEPISGSPFTSIVTQGMLFGTEQTNLLQVSTATGAGTIVGSTGITSMPALASHPSTGQLFLGTGAGAPNVYTVDASTGAVTLVGNSGLGFAAIGGMDFNSTGVLYAAVNIAGDGGTGSDHLATINTATGAATVIGPFGSCTGVPAPPVDGTGSCTLEGMEGIAFDADGTLYGSLSARGAAGAPGLYTIDLSTGAATFVTALDDGAGSPPSGGVVSLEFAPDGTLFGGTATGLGADDGGFLITIDPTTGLFAPVGPSPATSTGRSLAGLAFASGGTAGVPALSISDATVVEGDDGTMDAVFTVTLSAATGSTVTVDFATQDGTAEAPGDYASTSDQLMFTPGGDLTQTITVAVVSDTVTESAIETFTVVLSGSVNASIADAIGLGTILDDDPVG